MEISKKLVQSVLQIPVELRYALIRLDNVEYGVNCSLNEFNGTNYNSNIKDNFYVVERNIDEFVSIYEFMHKCKLWAREEGFKLESGYADKSAWCKIPELKHYISSINDGIQLSEPEAVINACQWILDLKKGE